MSLLIEVVALIADLFHHVLRVFGEGDSIRGNWAASFRSPPGGECIEYYRLAQVRRTTLIFIQQYKRFDDGRTSRQSFQGQGIRHGDLLYAYYTSTDKSSDRAGVMILRRSHEPATLEKLVRVQYLETYPAGERVANIEAEISLHLIALRFGEKIDLTFGRFLFSSFAEAKDSLARGR